MFIKRIMSQYRRDFTAVYECEHCGFTEESSGYDDSYFHQNVVPDMVCPNCDKKANGNYVPRVPKYPDNYTI